MIDRNHQLPITRQAKALAVARSTIDRPNQVFAMDITYIPMARGFVYLVAALWDERC